MPDRSPTHAHGSSSELDEWRSGTGRRSFHSRARLCSARTERVPSRGRSFKSVEIRAAWSSLGTDHRLPSPRHLSWSLNLQGNCLWDFRQSSGEPQEWTNQRACKFAWGSNPGAWPSPFWWLCWCQSWGYLRAASHHAWSWCGCRGRGRRDISCRIRTGSPCLLRPCATFVRLSSSFMFAIWLGVFPPFLRDIMYKCQVKLQTYNPLSWRFVHSYQN